jgi:adenylate cyclase class IV
MIEIEKKFILEDGDFERLIKGAIFLSKRTHTDIYYDNDYYSLTTKGIWLRKRNLKFELKIRLHKDESPEISRYNEIEAESEIQNFLKLPLTEPLEQSIKAQGYLPFCSIKTTRKKYKKNNFTLDFDLVDFGDYKYEVLEIELMANDDKSAKLAAREILNFAKKNRLEIKELNGKCKEYLNRYNPDHYQALIDAGI